MTSRDEDVIYRLSSESHFKPPEVPKSRSHERRYTALGRLAGSVGMRRKSPAPNQPVAPPMTQIDLVKMLKQGSDHSLSDDEKPTSLRLPPLPSHSSSGVRAVSISSTPANINSDDPRDDASGRAHKRKLTTALPGFFKRGIPKQLSSDNLNPVTGLVGREFAEPFHMDDRMDSMHRLNSKKRESVDAPFLFSGSPQPLIGAGEVNSMGTDDANGLFSFDPISQICVMVTQDGDLHLTTPDFDVRLSNDLSHVTVEHLVVIPGVHRVVTAGVQKLKKNEQAQWTSEREPGVFYRSILQIWDFSQFFPNSSKFLSSFRPKTVELAYTILCIQRIRHSRSMDASRLYRQCAKDADVEEGGKSPSRSPRVSNLKLEVAVKYFSHPDNSPYPTGDPSNDSRWIFTVGTSEGDVRLFDGWNCHFLDYLISKENICQQLGDFKGIPPVVFDSMKISRLNSLPAVKCVLNHPIDSHIILIGFSIGLIIQWDFIKHRVIRAYFPIPTQSIADQPAAVLSPTSPSTNSSSAVSVQTTLTPSDFIPPSFPYFLHSMCWHPTGAALVSCVSAIGADRLTERPTLSSPMLMVFGIGRSLPVSTISLAHPLREPLDDLSVPFIYWEALEKSQRGPFRVVSLLRGRLFFTLTPQTAKSSSEVQAVLQWYQSTQNLQKLITPTTPTRHRLSGYSRPPARRSVCNLWKLTGQLWSDGQPVFPVNPESPTNYSFTQAQLIAPSVQQMAAGSSQSFAAKLCGLHFPPDLEKDRGEDAETILEAASRLSRYLVAATFLIVFTDSPVRQLLGVCLKIDRNKSVLLSHLRPDHSYEEPAPTKTSPQLTWSAAPSVETTDSEDDFAPWESMKTPVCFTIDWQSLSFSNASAFATVPRFLTPAEDSQSSSPLPLFRMGPRGSCCLVTDGTEEKAKETEKTFNAWNSAVDAFYTVRKKHIVHGWLSGLLGKDHKISLQAIPRDLSEESKDDEASEASNQEPPGRFDQVGSNIGSAVNSDESSEDLSDEATEWRQLNEIRFFGDLLRISNKKWGKECLQTFKELVITGHTDGKVKIWAAGAGESILLHSVSIVSPVTLFNQEFQRSAFAPTESQIISLIDARPIVACMPEAHIITCVHLHIPGHKPTRRIVQQWHPDLPRYLCAGCVTGELVVFKWNSEATPVSPVELKYMKTGQSEEISDSDYLAWQQKSLDVDSMSPFGFSCLTRTRTHSARITCLHIVSFDSTDPLTPKERHPRPSLRSNLAAKVPRTSRGPPAPVLLKSHRIHRLFTGDSNGVISVLELPSGRVIGVFPALHSGGLQSNESRSVVAISTAAKPLVMALQKPLTRNDFSDGSSDRFVLITYSSGCIRVFDLISNRFLDDDGSPRFITRLDALGVPPRRIAAARGGDDGALKVLFFKELRVNPSALSRMCISQQRIDAEWPHVLFSNEAETMGEKVTSAVKWMKGPRGEALAGIFVVVATHWIGLVECKATEGGPTPRLVTGLDLPKEAIHGCITFVNNLPCIMVQVRGGFVEVYGVYFNANDELCCGLVSSVAVMSKLSSTRKAAITQQMNWAAGDWGGNIVFGRRTADTSNCSFFTSSIIEETHRQRELWMADVWGRLRSSVVTNCQRAAISSKGLVQKSSGTSLAAPSKAKGGWASSLVNKLGQWASDYANTTNDPSLRTFVRSAPRECLASARDARLRGREVSWSIPGEAPISLPISQTSSPMHSARQSMASSDAEHTPEQSRRSLSGHRTSGISEATASPRDFPTPPPPEALRSKTRKKSAWHTLFGGSPTVSLNNSPLPPRKFSNQNIPETIEEAYTPSERAKPDPWEAAQRAKERLEENLEKTRQTAVKADEMNQNAVTFMDLSKQLAEKYR